METSKKSRPKAILERMAAQEAEALEHKLRQDAKDREFAEFLRSIEGESTKAAAVVAEAKAALADAGEHDERKVRLMKEERQRSIENITNSLEMAERLCTTFRTLELNSSAVELEQFCVDCGCVHTIDVLKD